MLCRWVQGLGNEPPGYKNRNNSGKLKCQSRMGGMMKHKCTPCGKLASFRIGEAGRAGI
jgi:hypothetical protein